MTNEHPASRVTETALFNRVLFVVSGNAPMAFLAPPDSSLHANGKPRRLIQTPAA